LQCRNLLREAIRLGQLPLTVHALVVSTTDTLAEVAALGEVEVAPQRLQGAPSDWYFVEVYSERDAASARFHLISHRLLQYMNRNASAEWVIPLRVCEPYSVIRGPPAFDLYQRDLATCAELGAHGVIRDVLHERMYLFKWMSCSAQFKARHPLSDFHLRYAAVPSRENPFDTIAFHLLAHAVARVPQAKRRWMEGEVRLLRFKLMQRPDLHSTICEAAGVPGPPSFEAAEAAIPQLVASAQARISARTDPWFDAQSRLAKLATAFHRALLIWEREELEDERAQRRSDAERARVHVRHLPFKVSDPEPMHMVDVEECAPPCMKAMSREVLGSVEQRAAASESKRRHFAHFLMELGHEEGEAVRIMRPRPMVEYEVAGPQVSWPRIQRVVQQAHAERQYNLIERDEHFQSCDKIMLAGLCPCLPPVGPRRHLLTPQQRAAEDRQRYAEAHAACHQQLVHTWHSRKGRKLSDGRAVRDEVREWTRSPYVHALVALKGAAASAAHKRKAEGESHSE